jgi:2-polyprenyl-3-methyl-5-hydroxy-6-metoxy-1,4-benzoquinol methylase
MHFFFPDSGAGNWNDRAVEYKNYPILRSKIGVVQPEGIMASQWETAYRDHAWLSIHRIRRHVPDLDFEGKRIADIGCWWGWFMRYARQQRGSAYGFDYERKRIVNAQEFLQRTEGLCVASAEEIPYKSEFFDIAFSYHVLEHIENEGAVLQEIHRILKKDGVLVIAVPNDFSFSTLPFRPLRWLLRHTTAFLQAHKKYDWLKSITCNDISHFREYTGKMLSTALAQNHFKIVSIKMYGLELPYPIKGRLNKKIRAYINWLFGPVTPPYFRSEIIAFARKA